MSEDSELDINELLELLPVEVLTRYLIDPIFELIDIDCELKETEDISSSVVEESSLSSVESSAHDKNRKEDTRIINSFFTFHLKSTTSLFPKGSSGNSIKSALISVFSY